MINQFVNQNLYISSHRPPNHHTPMVTRKHQPPPRSNRTTLASCIVAATFLTFITTIILIIFFTLLKPQPPTITLTAVQLPIFTITNSTLTFTISHYVAVHNPNHGVFTHYDTSIHLLYDGNQMGFVFVPSGEIGPRRTEYLAATYVVKSFPVVSGMNGMNGLRVGSSLEIETRMEMAGRVRVLHFFMHHVKGRVRCKVEVGVNEGSVLGFRC